MGEKLSILEETVCGVCDQPVWIATAFGTHALLEIDGLGLKTPHRCPDPAVDRWRRVNERFHRMRLLVFPPRKDRST